MDLDLHHVFFLLNVPSYYPLSLFLLALPSCCSFSCCSLPFPFLIPSLQPHQWSSPFPSSHLSISPSPHLHIPTLPLSSLALPALPMVILPITTPLSHRLTRRTVLITSPPVEILVISPIRPDTALGALEVSFAGIEAAVAALVAPV